MGPDSWDYSGSQLLGRDKVRPYHRLDTTDHRVAPEFIHAGEIQTLTPIRIFSHFRNCEKVKVGAG